MLAHCNGAPRIQIVCQVFDMDKHGGLLRSVSADYREAEIIGPCASVKDVQGEVREEIRAYNFDWQEWGIELRFKSLER